MNSLTEARELIATTIEGTGRTVDRTQPEIISPDRIVIQQGDYGPAERFGHISSTTDLDVLVDRHASFHDTQLALDTAISEILIALLNAIDIEIVRISAPFNIQDTEGTLLPAATITLTQEIQL